MLGSIDANTGSPDLGWDTDQFPMDIKDCTKIMKVSTGKSSSCQEVLHISTLFCGTDKFAGISYYQLIVHSVKRVVVKSVLSDYNLAQSRWSHRAGGPLYWRSLIQIQLDAYEVRSGDLYA